MPFRYTERVESDEERLQKQEEEKKEALRDHGKLQAKLEIARNLKGMGLSIDQISNATELSLEELASQGIT